MTRRTDDELRERFERDAAEAHAGGEKPSEYFLDKCGAEAAPVPPLWRLPLWRWLARLLERRVPPSEGFGRFRDYER